MPKIIENGREQLLAEARRQISERGYSETTIRSVAGACGLAVGTVYNYFKSKDMLIASFVLEDWIECLAKMRTLPTDDKEAFLSGVYDTLLGFARDNEKLFSNEDAAKQASTGSAKRHKLLRRQITELILPITKSTEDFTAEFIAESLISWSAEGKDSSLVIPILLKLIES